MSFTLTAYPGSIFMRKVNDTMKTPSKKGWTILAISLIVVIGVAVGLIMRFPKTGSEKRNKADTERLFSFESYEEITGAKIRFSNSFGATSINTQEQFITDGKASWLVKPQGSYAEPMLYPTVQFNCVGSTFGSSDFSAFDSILMDIYNDSDEEIKLNWAFTMNNTLGSSADASQEFTLAPKAWTTCAFDLTSEDYTYYYVLDYVGYMKISFLCVKGSREDSVPDLYIDNVRGHYSATSYISSPFAFNLAQGVGFEEPTDKYVIKVDKSSSVETYMPLTRVTYADTSIQPLDSSFGKYVLKGTATGRPYPGFTLDFGRTYGEGDTLKFMMYVEVDPAKAEGKVFKAEGKSGILYTAYPGNYSANEWVEVYIPLLEYSDSLYLFVNLSRIVNGEVSSIFGDDTPVTVYLDNFTIENTKGMVQKQDDGSYILSNPYGMNYTVLDLYGDDYGGFKEGDYLVFDSQLNLNEPAMMWVLGDGKWGPGYETIHPITGNAKQTNKVSFTQNWDHMQIYIRFDGKDNYSDYEVRISNIGVYHEKVYNPGKYDFTKGISFETAGEQEVLQYEGLDTYNKEDTYMPLSRLTYAQAGITAPDASCGNYVVAGNATNRNYPAFTIHFDKYYGKGSTLQFKMYVKADAAIAEGKTFKVEGKDSVGGSVFFNSYPENMEANRWIDVSIPITTDSKSMYFFLNLYDQQNAAANYRLFGKTSVTVYFDCFYITDTEEETQHTESGNIVLANPYGNDFVTTDLYGKDYGGFKAGNVLSFSLSMNEPETITMWVLGDGKWGKGYETVTLYEQEISASKTIRVTFTQDWEFVNVYIGYRGEGNYKTHVATLSDIAVEGAMTANGSFIIRDPSNTAFVYATVQGDTYGGFHKGETLSFVLDMNVKETVSVWVLGNGSWGSANKMKVLSNEEVEGQRAVAVQLDKDYSYVDIYIQYLGDGNYADHIAVLKEFVVE